jgi:hypothetical protein
MNNNKPAEAGDSQPTTIPLDDSYFYPLLCDDMQEFTAKLEDECGFDPAKIRRVLPSLLISYAIDMIADMRVEHDQRGRRNHPPLFCDVDMLREKAEDQRSTKLKEPL